MPTGSTSTLGLSSMSEEEKKFLAKHADFFGDDKLAELQAQAEAENKELIDCMKDAWKAEKKRIKDEKVAARIEKELKVRIYCGPDGAGKIKALQTGWDYLGNQTIKKFYKSQKISDEVIDRVLSKRPVATQSNILTRIVADSKMDDSSLENIYMTQGYAPEAIATALAARAKAQTEAKAKADEKAAAKAAAKEKKAKKGISTVGIINEEDPDVEEPKQKPQHQPLLKSVKLALGIGIPLAAIVLSGIGIGAGHDAYKNIASDMLNQRLSDYLVAFLEERGVTAEQIKNNEEFATAFNEYAQERLTADVAHKDLIQKAAIKTAMKKAGDLNKKFEVSPIAEETKQDFAELNDEQRQQIKESLGSFLGTNSNAVIQNVYGKITTEGDKQYVRFLVKNEGEATDYMLKVAINGEGITNNEGLVNRLKNNPINSEDVKRYERIYNVFKDEVARDAIIDKCEELAGEELENGECFVSVTNKHGDRGNKVTVDFEEHGTTEKDHVTIVVNNFASVANASKEVAIQAIEAIANPTLEMPELPGNTITGSAGADVQVAHTPLPGVVTSTEYDIVFPDGTKISSAELEGPNA